MPDNAPPAVSHSREDVMAWALAAFTAGRVPEAMRLWEAVLAAHPADADALTFLGIACDAAGDPARGVALIDRALALHPSPGGWCNRGMVLSHMGRHAEALDSYDRALALRPGYPEALSNRGVVLEALHRPGEAEVAYREAIALRPDYAEALGNLGNALRSQGRLDAAVEAYERSVAASLGRNGPQTLAGSANLAQVLLQLGRADEAIAACQNALAVAPEEPAAWTILGEALRALDRLAESETALRRAVALRPADPARLNALALTLHTQDRPAEALAVLDRAAALAPQDAETQHHRAMLLLLQGRYAEGWALYDWRLQTRQAGNGHAAFAGQARWRGEELGGRTILLAPEQGLGDAIQCVRYAPLVAARGGRVVLGLRPALRTLFAAAPGISAVVAVGEPVPPYDVYCPLMSLPGVFGATPETIPAAVPYLAAPPESVARWAAWLGGLGPGHRVGVVWGGNPEHLQDRRRSVPIEALEPLWQVPGVHWFSLQVGARAADLAAIPGERLPAEGLDDLSPLLTDFAETAAAIAGLDLVIAVDTAVAHLAGALGRPVWLLLPNPPDWRWLRTGDTSAWYPTMRLFRQGPEQAWGPVIAAVAAALAGRLA